MGQRLESIEMEDGRIPLLREVKCNLSVPSSYPIKYRSQGSQKRLAFLDSKTCDLKIIIQFLMAKKVKLNLKCELLLHYLENKLTVTQLMRYAEEKYDLKVSRQSIGKWITQKDEIIASQNLIGKLKSQN